MLYQICNGAVRFAAETILENVNFEIRNTEKIAVVGRNGSGKTTLLKLISGEVDLSKRDSDEDMTISHAGNPTIGYLKQLTFEDENLTLDAEIRKVFAPILNMKKRLAELVEEMEADATEKKVAEYTALEEKFKDLGGYYYEKEYDTMLRSFQFDLSDKEKKLSEFSGGQRTKLAFIKLLLSKPDILLLDEPTNHLDISTIEWLEKYLQNYNRAVVIVSHDRMFLDKVVDVVYEIEHQKVKRYVGNYSAFMMQKRQNYDKQMKDHIAQQKEIARLEAIVEKFKNKPTKVAMTRSKLKQIEHMEIIEAPDRYDNKTFHASFEPGKETGRDVLLVTDLLIGYDKPLARVSLDLKRGQKLGIIGGNGIGKSTLLKTLVGMIEPLSGSCHYGDRVEVGYFDQQMAQYSSEKTVLDEFWDEFPNLVQTEVRNCLGAFLFSGDDVFKKVSMLSGGERVRLALAKIFKRRPNFLILDEPTNHMDIVGKETLESMLKDFPGTVIFVSHDRYFIKQVSDILLVMDKNKDMQGETLGEYRLYPFGYEQYIEETEKAAGNTEASNQNQYAKIEKKSNAGMPSGKTETQEDATDENSKYYNPGKEQSKLERKIKRKEEQLEECETELQQLKDELQNPELVSNYIRLQEIQNDIDEREEMLLDLMSEWDELQSLLTNC
ncbi:MAG: ABC-F family ATP-binding cassette domain-containing protein [bacterium]|nr:ABC-F family ATP-binding cassette domain-containing protein [bacterium]